MKTMMKTTQYWGVSIKFFDSGKVKANIFPVEAATKPESMKEENLMCDEYRDFFDTFEEAVAQAVSPFSSPRFNRYARLKEREV